MSTLPPPEGFSSWLDWAVATMATDAIRGSAAAELAELRATVKRLQDEKDFFMAWLEKGPT